MALMLGKLYDALRQGGTAEKEAREAAEEVAAYERDIAGLRTEIRVVQAVGGVIVVVLFAALWQLFALRGEMSELAARSGPGSRRSRSGCRERPRRAARTPIQDPEARNGGRVAGRRRRA